MNKIVECPHCKCQIEIVELNCKIFRHGVYKISGQQISPHAPKSECDRLFENGFIYGCGKPFRIVEKDNNLEVEICDYI